MTVYNLLKQEGIELSKEDLGAIGVLISNAAKESALPKVTIKQKEYNGKFEQNFTVRDYPDTFIETMRGIIKLYQDCPKSLVVEAFKAVEPKISKQAEWLAKRKLKSG